MFDRLHLHLGASGGDGKAPFVFTVQDMHGSRSSLQPFLRKNNDQRRKSTQIERLQQALARAGDNIYFVCATSLSSLLCKEGSIVRANATHICAAKIWKHTNHLVFIQKTQTFQHINISNPITQREASQPQRTPRVVACYRR